MRGGGRGREEVEEGGHGHLEPSLAAEKRGSKSVWSVDKRG